MHFTEQQIEQAIELENLGLEWTPSAGHYAYDVASALRPSSPFRIGVYFLLDLDCFLRAVGGLDEFKRLMVWLPTWEHAREILRYLKVSDAEIVAELGRTRAISNRGELFCLYRLIEHSLC
ncbi:MAG: hypothetical protein AAGB04_00660 [Pseudomonadota bacterium]